MKLSYAFVTTTLLLAACSKKNDLPQYAGESYPQKVILVMEDPNDDDFYDYFTAQLSYIRRAETGKSDDAVKDLFNSIHATDCVWIAHLSGNLIYFQLASDTSKYLQVSPNRLSSEYVLTASGRSMDQSHLFRKHNLDLQNGVTIVTMESVMYPKYFFSREGVAGESNAVKMVEHSDAKDATKVRWYGRRI